MEFDSPEAAKEFPGLYSAEAGKVDDSLEYQEDGDKKKSKKEKKKDKDKGYSALAAESSHDEDDPLDPKSPGKGKKIKAFSKLSGKKKEKKSDKSGDKDQKKAEKEAKEKRKSEEKERKSLEKELSSTPGPVTVAPVTPRPQIPFSGAHLMKANSFNHSTPTGHSLDRTIPAKKTVLNLSTTSSNTSGEGASSTTSSVKPHKEKSAGFNVFLNAPAPLLSKLKDKDKDGSKEKHGKSKEHKEKDKKVKDKDKGDKSKKENKDSKEKKEHSHASGMAKVKLKLMRSKNSLEDPNDPPHVISHQFPEEPDQIAKEIKKYEGLLEQAHLHIKASKKISKKQEEQLWELQRTLTQLKRKLRSINALSSASSYHVHTHSASKPEQSVSPAAHPIFKKCDSIDGHALVKASSTLQTCDQPAETVVSIPSSECSVVVPKAIVEQTALVSVPVTSPSAPIEIPKIPQPPSKSSYKGESGCVSSRKLSPTPPPFVSGEAEHKSPCSMEVSKSNRNSVILSSPTVVSSGNETTPVPEPVISPRQSIDIVAQVHPVVGLSGNKSETEDGPIPVEQEDDEDFDKRSISNLSIESSQVDSKESIEAVLDDANKMIGSMHEELMFEATMDLVNGDDRLLSGERIGDSSSRILGQEDSDVELFTNDLELELPNEEPCPDPFSMPIFDTQEYLSIENEALSMFNEQLTEDIRKEQRDLEKLLDKLPVKPQPEEEDLQLNENDYNEIIKTWTQLKSENEVLWDNVNRLRQAVALCKVDEFRLQTRLKYIETKTSALSPVTTTTPLQTES